MLWRVEVKNKQGFADPVSKSLEQGIFDLGIKTVSKVCIMQVFIIGGEISQTQIKKICEDLLTDPVSQEYKYGEPGNEIFKLKQKKDFYHIEIAYKPGVMDPWQESIKKGINDLGINCALEIRTRHCYLISGKLSEKQSFYISEKLFYNKVIQQIVESANLKQNLTPDKKIKYKFKKNVINLIDLNDAGLLALSGDMQLYLNLVEMREIKEYFSKLKRDPVDCELETIAQTWSEHCKHKTMCGTVEYRDASLPGLEQTKVIHNLLKSTIMSATKILNKPWCVSVFKDNAGIVKFDHNHNICFKVETHNHPSALEPYGGAGTGIGGVIRDILGVGLGAKPIMNNDVFCFGPPELAVQDVPDGALHPLRVMKGVVAGVKDYGNKMGIPTVNGAVIFDPRYTANPLVYCGTVGIMPKEYSFGSASSGEYVVVVGGRTGRDGIHGATFSSGSLTNASEMSSSGAVQIGNPITEKKVLDTLLNARDKKLYTAITDCGAGGLSSAVGEMGEEIGVRIELEKVPLKYAGLNYTEIWISEAQERMVLSVPEENLKSLLELFTQEDVEAVVIGCFTNTKQLELFYQDVCVCSLSMEFLHNGLPLLTRKALWKKPLIKETKYEPARNLTGELLKILSDLNVCSKEWIIRQYDHEVQGMSVLKPLSGICNDGPQDAAVVKPFADSKKGITISCGINSRYSDIDPYYMAVSCIDEALRQIVAVGGSLEHSCILDNFSWGNTDKPEILGGLVRACLGCRDASLAYKVPFISGKDSLHNEYIVGNQTISIPQTLLISAMAVILDVEKVISADAKTEGNLIYCIGTTFAEMGGSCYYAVNNWQSGSVPKVDFQQNKAVFEKLSYCIDKGMLEACHDCSEGGMAVALAEMAFGGGLGMEIFLDKVKHHIPKDKPRDDILLFSESNGRFVVEVEEEKKENFEKILQGIPFSMIGKLTDKQKFLVYGIDNRLVVDCAVGVLKDAWQKPLRDFG